MKFRILLSKLQKMPATWTTTIVGVPGENIMELEAVFVRYRFPNIRFEWEIRNPNFELQSLRTLNGGTTGLYLNWRAISLASEAGEANPLLLFSKAS